MLLGLMADSLVDTVADKVLALDGGMLGIIVAPAVVIDTITVVAVGLLVPDRVMTEVTTAVVGCGVVSTFVLGDGALDVDAGGGEDEEGTRLLLEAAGKDDTGIEGVPGNVGEDRDTVQKYQFQSSSCLILCSTCPVVVTGHLDQILHVVC